MDEAERMVEAATGPDPEAGLAAVVALRGLVEVLEALQVDHARAQGEVVARHRRPAGCQQAGGALQARPALPGTVSVALMWERLDAPARRVMVAALDWADDLGHHYIGDEHLLLGLLGAGTRTPAGRAGSWSVTA